MTLRLLPLDPSTYVPHTLHSTDRAWLETNCYVDLWIEVLHAFSLDPLPLLGFAFSIDFEGDQWTMFKPSFNDLYELYGIDVREMNVWRPLLTHIVEHVGQGRPVLIEMDAFYLPDTVGVLYRQGHSKSMIAVQEIDVDTRTLGYFHNTGYYALRGDDFDGLFRIGRFVPLEPMLAPYTEFARFEHLLRHSSKDLCSIAVGLVGMHLARRPRVNPVARFRLRFVDDMTWLMDQDINTFHQYAFATLRQIGACGELAGIYLRWLKQHGELGLERAITELDTTSNAAKAIQFKMARSIATKRPLEVNERLDEMESAWDTAISLLVSRYCN